MVQDSVTGAPAQFSVGGVMGGSFRVLGRNFIPFILLSIVCTIPSLLVTLLKPAVQRLFTGELGTTPPVPVSGDRVLLTLLGWLVSILSHALNQSALVYGTF